MSKSFPPISSIRRESVCVSDYSLISDPPLAGYNRQSGDISLRAPSGLSIVSVSLPLDGDSEADKAIEAAFGAALPDPGKSVCAKDGARLIRLGQDQAFIIFHHTAPDAERVVARMLDSKAYTTDQTDVWVCLEIDGTNSRRALERICPIDLHPDAFAQNDAARTVMEHLGALVVRTGANGFLLLSASSSAGSFLHAVETSVKNVS